MTNYYEALKITPNASSQDIETVIDRLYDETRRRVTSFDPQVVAQANQGLMLLEQMRATLLDPEKRATYDLTLGLSGSGLLDPEAQVTPTDQISPSLGMPSVSMNFGQTATSSSPVVPGAIPVEKTTWTCTQCRAENPPQTMFCKSCGGLVGLTCPKCHSTWEVAATQYCPTCGGHLQTEVQRKKLQDRLSTVEQQLTQAAAENPRRDTEIANFRSATLRAAGWAALLFVFRLLPIKVPSLSNFLGISNSFGEMLPESASLWVVLAVITIVLAVLIRSRWTITRGALFAAGLWVALDILGSNGYFGDVYGSIEGSLMISGLLLLIDLAITSQPGKFAENLDGQASWLKATRWISTLCRFAVFFIFIALFNSWTGVLTSIDIPFISFSTLNTAHTAIYWIVAALLLLQIFFGLGRVSQINHSVHEALRSQAQRVKELTGEAENLKQDLSHIAR